MSKTASVACARPLLATTQRHSWVLRTCVLLLLLAMVACGKSSDEAAAKSARANEATAKATQSAEIAPAKPADPYEVATAKAQQENTAAAWSELAEMYERKADSLKGTSAEEPAREQARRAWGHVLKADKEHARAHTQLGHVLFDPEWLVAAKADKDIGDDLKGDLEIAHDEVLAAALDGKARRTWMSARGTAASEWKRLTNKAEGVRAAARERASDPFQRDAISMGSDIIGDIESGKVNFLRKGVSGDAFMIFPTKPYVLMVQRDAAGMENKIAEDWGDVLHSLQATFYPMLARETGATPPRGPIPVLILRDNGEYTKYCRRSDPFAPITSGGHYEPWSNRLVVYKSRTEAERETLFHEGTHQLVEAAMKTTGSDKGMRQALWFSEGLADYFGGHAREWDGAEKRWRYIPGNLNPERIESLVKAKERGSLFPLAELLEYRRFNYVKDKDNPQKSDVVMNAYAQGWGLCYLLANWQDGKYREEFIRYVKAEFEGKSGRSTFEGVFGKYGIAALEKEFLSMIDELGKAKKEGRILDGKLVPTKK